MIHPTKTSATPSYEALIFSESSSSESSSDSINSAVSIYSNQGMAAINGGLALRTGLTFVADEVEEASTFSLTVSQKRSVVRGRSNSLSKMKKEKQVVYRERRNSEPNCLKLTKSPTVTFSTEFIQSYLKVVERTQMYRYFTKFDVDTPDFSVMSVLQNKYPGAKIELKEISEGASSTCFILVNKTIYHVLKSNSLPQHLDWMKIQILLKETGHNNLHEQITELFLNKPNLVTRQDFPYFNNVQREKLAYVIGSDMGVPETIILNTSDGVFSLHHYIVNNAGSSRTYDLMRPERQAQINVQSLQDIAILDMLIENQDRNPGNIMVCPVRNSPQKVFHTETKSDSESNLDESLPLPSQSEVNELHLFPIDHALSLQQTQFKFELKQQTIKSPCWIKWSKSNETLTDQTRDKIHKLDAKTLLLQLENNGIIVDEKIGSSITHNVQFLKTQIEKNPTITLLELYHLFINS